MASTNSHCDIAKGATVALPGNPQMAWAQACILPLYLSPRTALPKIGGRACWSSLVWVLVCTSTQLAPAGGSGQRLGTAQAGRPPPFPHGVSASGSMSDLPSFALEFA